MGMEDEIISKTSVQKGESGLFCYFSGVGYAMPMVSFDSFKQNG